jgi:hypothetical protein
MPGALAVVCMLLLLDGVLVLLGCLFYTGQDPTRPYYAVGSTIIIVTSILMWINHKWSLTLSFICAILITTDLILEHILPLKNNLASAHTLWEIARTLFNVGLYWAAFFWYRRWRAAGGTLDRNTRENE